MSIDYIVAERFNPAKPSEQRKFYAQQKSRDEVNLRGFKKIISGRSTTVSAIDIQAVIEMFLQTIPELLADGRIVRLGDFGSFYITIKSSGSDTKDGFNSGLIKEVSVKFRPGKEMKKALKNVSFNRIKE